MSEIRLKLTVEQKWYLIFQKKRGLSFDEIVQNFQAVYNRNIAYNTILSLWKKYEQTGSVENLQKS
jgi:hypothetical protein